MDASMDPLSDILELIGIRSSIYFQKDFCNPWKMTVSDTGFAQFHFIVRGGAIVEHAGKQDLLAAGDVVVFPKGASHWIGDHPNTPGMPGAKVITAMQAGQEPFTHGPLATRMICGHFEYDLSHPHPLVQQLPSQIILRTAELPTGNLLMGLLPLIINETKSTPIGNRVVLQQLSQALFTSILRAYFDRENTQFAPLSDARIMRALSAIHGPSGWQHSLSDLAELAGMSRSSFAAKFKTDIGQSPGEYAMCWKLMKAKQTLQTTNLPIEQIAHDNGYTSASAFSRAFRETLGMNPSQCRATSDA